MKSQALWVSVGLSTLVLSVALGRPGPGQRPKPGPRPTPVTPGNKDGKPKKDTGGMKPDGKKKPPPTKSGLPTKVEDLLVNVAKNPQTPAPARDAIGNLLGGNFLSGQDRKAFSDLIDGGKDWLSAEDRGALSEGLKHDSRHKLQVQSELVVENATGERLTVWVHYHGLNDKAEWAWTPALPPDAGQAIRYVLPPGPGTYVLQHRDAHILANQVRLWARSDSGKTWLNRKDKDLPLVPDADEDPDPGTRVKQYHVQITAPRDARQLTAIGKK